MDRFPESKGKDSQDEPVYANCEATDGEIYYGESYLETPEGNILKDKLEAVVEHFKLQRKYAGEEII